MAENVCARCIWAVKRHFDVSMRFCKLKCIEVYAGSIPCSDYERYDETF